ncbi:ribosomal protection-like ABC-F family protein [Ureibacillus sinduriensis]|uniref:ABC transporter ATP-binding protein n=1 Tax=Ureibacillus sinduriensis BLB-1 = JCM 15800 TaxID=1384057 RepID=A0A0A3I508_9BACL|nr:ABC-F type ribosomal protection protein [Ureibacillus sinduriensis]KGR78615.1 ABC transporter ATP-binding protein [Ureibacillus sinduriensis BLB-1 = JCM 15800]
MSIKAENITKIYGGTVIFEGLTLEINDGERVAIVGRNGCGKTTLLKVLASIESPDVGRIIKRRGTSIGYLHQIPPYEDVLAEDVLKEAFKTILEMQEKMQQLEQQMAVSEQLDKLLKQYGEIQEQFMMLGGYEIEAKIQMIANGLGITPLLHTPFQLLSGGEKTKVMLGQILLLNPQILLLDEPTNHLDMNSIEWLEGYLKNYEGTLIVVSHDRQFMNEVVTKVIEIEDGEPYPYKGNYDDFVEMREARILNEFSQYEEQQKKIAKMKETIKRLKIWANEANPPNAALHRRAKSMEKALARIELVKKPVITKKMQLKLEVNERSGKDVVIYENVTKKYDKVLFEDISLQLRWQDRLAIVGLNGTGKSTLLKMITEEVLPDFGKITVGSNVKIGYLSQNFVYEDMNARLIDVFRKEVHIAEGEARHILAKFLFYGYDVFKKVKDLSGGEKMRLRLAQLMHEEINLLILDEPTNHLDIESREVLEETVQHFNGTVLAVSHDRYFLNQLFQRIAWIENQQLFIYNGNFHWARQKHNERPIQAASEPFAINALPKSQKTSNTSIEKQIEQLEAKIKKAKESLGATHLSVGESELERLENKLDELLAVWLNE